MKRLPVNPLLHISKSSDGLSQRIVAMLKASGSRNVMWFRSFAATDAIFFEAIGRLFVKGQVKFVGKGKARKLALRGRR